MSNTEVILTAHIPSLGAEADVVADPADDVVAAQQHDGREHEQPADADEAGDPEGEGDIGLLGPARDMVDLAPPTLICGAWVVALLLFYAWQTARQLSDKTPLIAIGPDGVRLPSATSGTSKLARVTRLGPVSADALASAARP